MIIFTDVHLDEDSAPVVFNEVLPGVAEAAVKLGDKDIACLGDWLNIRYRVSGKLLVGLRDVVTYWTHDLGLNLRVLPGNHDMHDIEGRTVLEMLADIEGVLVYRQPTWDRDGLWIPYQATSDKFLKALARTPPRIPPPRNAFIHQGVLGAWMNGNIRNDDGVPLQTFSTWNKVMSGHYHLHHTVGNVTYIGSPWETRADEAGQVKGFAQWDGQTLLHHPRHWGPRHIKLDVTAPLNLTQLRPTDIVTATVPAGYDVQALGKQLAAAGVKNHTLTPEVPVNEARLSVGAHADMVTYANAYVDKLAPPELDKKRLMKIFREVAL